MPKALRASPPTSTETVFEVILADIVRGRYAPGARLPAERDLSRMLGSSRPTLREALRRLAEWRLIEPKRGSGVVVNDKYEWSIEVLPAYLRYARPGPKEPSIAQMLRDLLSIRRRIIRDMISVVAGRMPPGSTDKPRAAVMRAWEARHDLRTFTIEDFGVMRAIVEAASFLPAVWLLNRISGIYLDVARSLSGTVVPPDHYVATHERFLAALEAGDSASAAEIIEGYLEDHDRGILAALEVFA